MMTNRIDIAFDKLRSRDKKAFIAFLTAGYPDLSVTKELVLEMDRRGVDLIELGIPFSDPMADGPVIQESSQAALSNSLKLSDVLKMMSDIREYSDIPVVFMTYFNPVFRMGEARFLRAASESGLDGVIVPDLPLEEGAYFDKMCSAAGLHNIRFVAPTTDVARLETICRGSGGFIYYISLAGVTGARRSLPSGVAARVRTIKRMTETPVCVGFGVSTSEQVARIRSFADGVIVGSAIIKNIKQHIGDPDLVAKTGAFVSRLMGKK